MYLSVNQSPAAMLAAAQVIRNGLQMKTSDAPARLEPNMLNPHREFDASPSGSLQGASHPSHVKRGDNLSACVAKGATTATDICLAHPATSQSSRAAARVGVEADDSGLDTLPLHRASHPYHVKRGANLSALHACMRGQGRTDRDRHMFGPTD